MPLIELKDYVFYQNANFTDRLQPLKHFKAYILATKNCVFIFPKESRGEYLLFEIKTTYDIFEGTPIEEVIQKIISKSDTPAQLEQSITKLLNNNEKYVHVLKEKSMCKFGSFLGKHTMMISYREKAFVSILVSGKSKQFRNFLGM